MSPQQQPRLTKKIRDLVARDRHSRPPIGRLTADHVKALTTVARRQARYDVEVSVPDAIAALAMAAPAEDALAVIKAVLADSGAPQPDQVAAARALGWIATPDAERIILQALNATEPRVQQQLLAALGTFGSPSAAPPLSELSKVPDEAVQRQLALTQALIAHRHALDGPFLPLAQPATRPRGRAGDRVAVSLSVKTARAVAADSKKLTGSTYGIGFATRGLGLRCGPADWTIFLNESLGTTPTDLAPIFERPWIAAVLAQRYPTREALTTRMVMLTRPMEEEVRIELARADGEVLYIGAARRSKNGIAFTISDVDRPGRAPTHLSGELTPRGIGLRSSVVLAARRDVRIAEDVALSSR